MKLHLYFARKFLVTFLGILAGFFIFMWLIELLEHVRRFDSDTLSFAEMAYLSVLHLPEVLYQIITLVVLLTAVMMFINLARTSELVIARATGRSAMRSLTAPLLSAFLLGLLVVGVGNPIVAALSKKYESEVNRLRGLEETIAINADGLWLREGNASQQTAIRAESANLDGTSLYNVTFLGFQTEGTPIFRVDAAEAELVEGAWLLRDAKRWNFVEGTNPEVEAEIRGTLLIPSVLTRDQIRGSFGTPASIPIWELPDFIQKLDTAGFSSRSHRVWFQAELARPILFVAMVMIGAVFTLRHTRMGRTGLMVLLAVLSGFAVYFTGNLTKVMGESGQMPILWAVWSPPVAAICFALGTLLHIEDG